MNSKRLTFLVVSLTLAFFLASTLPLIAQGEQSVKVNAKIGGKLVLINQTKTIDLSVDPVDQPTAQGGHVLIVKTNAPAYSILGDYGTFEVEDYDLIGNGNLTVASTAPDEGEGTGGSFVNIDGEVQILAGEEGYTNNEETPITYKLTVDFTVPTGEACTTVVYTASMQT